MLEKNEKTQITQTIVKNESKGNVFFKPENESEPLTLAPHTSAERIDGIKFCGRVYKLCNGTDVIIDSNNKITTKALTGKFANLTMGGVLTSPPDPSWQPLFDA